MGCSLPDSSVYGQWTSTQSFLWTIGSCFSKGKLLLSFISLFFKLFILYWILANWASLVAQKVKNLPAMQETQVQPLGREDPLEKEMTAQSSVLAWRVPCTEARVHAVAKSQTGLSPTNAFTVTEPIDNVVMVSGAEQSYSDLPYTDPFSAKLPSHQGRHITLSRVKGRFFKPRELCSRRWRRRKSKSRQWPH